MVFGVEPHSHDGDQEHCHLSAKYNEYIQIHLDNLKAKCLHLNACINRLLADQSYISVLKGQNLGLRKICGLINVKDKNSTEVLLDGKCTIHERWDLKEDVEAHLRDKIQKKQTWEKVNDCLSNNYGDEERTTYVQEICQLAENEDKICSDYPTHHHVEKFVNEQIEHLQCTCKSLHRDHGHSHMSVPMMAGLGAGAVLLVCLVLLIIFLCYRRRRNKKKKKRENVVYLPSANSDCPVYQEIYDKMSPPHSPPTLPDRYNSRPLPCHPTEDTEYLEPIQVSEKYRSKAPPPLQRLINNPEYGRGSPPEYSETDQLYEDAVGIEDDNVYIDPIQTPKTEKDKDGTLDSLGQEVEDVESANRPEEERSKLLSLSDVDVNKPLGPSPAQRTKKADRETESEYFELEKEGEEGEEEVGKQVKNTVV